MRFFLAVFFVLMWTLPTLAEPYRLAVYGDSLSSGSYLMPQDSFCSQLETALRQKGYDVIVLNVSRGGETTWGGVRRLPSLLEQKPDGVILELGLNDSLRHVALSSTEENLKLIITRLQENHIPVLLVGMESILLRIPRYRQDFKQMYQRLARQYHLPFYPFFMKGIINTFVGEPIGLPENFMLNDLHPNAKGIQIMVDNILPTVERFLKENGV